MRCSRAFSLLEMLVALSVFSLLLGILFTIFNEATRAWGYAQRQTDAFREARAALHIISRDLENACITTAMPLKIQSAATFTTLAPETGSTLFFVSSQSLSGQESSDLSDLCTIGYYCAYTPNRGPATQPLPRSYKLYRYYARSNRTWQNLRQAAPDFYNFTGAPFLSAPNTSLSGDEVLAYNICNLHIAYLTNGAPTLIDDMPVTFSDHALQQIEITFDAFNFATATRFYHPDDAQARVHWQSDVSPLGALWRAHRQTLSVRVTLPHYE